MTLLTLSARKKFQPPVTERHLEAEVAHCVGGVSSPILSNIYLDRLDTFVEQTLIPQHTRGTRRANNPAYHRVTQAIVRARANGDHAAVHDLHQRQRRMPSVQPDDPGYRRLRYIRYADGHLLGFTGSPDPRPKPRRSNSDSPSSCVRTSSWNWQRTRR
jgi:hypothetical protein